MNRMELLRILSLAAPALARNDFVPILSHFWFTGSKLIAYNDQIGVSVACKTEFKGAIKGDVLLGLLKQSRAKEVSFVPGDDGVIQIKAGSAKIKLGLERPESFLWEMPKPESGAIKIGKPAAFLQALRSVMRSVSTDTTIPDRIGVTFIAEDGGVGLYSSNANSMSYAHHPLKDKWPARVILPAAFCDHLLSVCAGTQEPINMTVQADHVIAECEGVLIYSRVIESERPINYARAFNANVTADLKKAVPIPSKMKLILERACIISESKESKVLTSIRASDGRLFFSTKSPDRGEISDSTQIAEGHPNVKVELEARHIRAAFDAYHNSITEQNGSLLISSRSFAFIKGKMIYMLAVVDK